MTMRKPQPNSVIVARCFLAVMFLAAVMTLDADLLQAQQNAVPPASIRVAVYEAKGVSDSVLEVLHDLKADTAVVVERISTDQILKDELNSFDVVVFSGGSGGAQGKSLGVDGREKVRSFIEDGGGYVGICAGAYLASADYDWSLHILDAKVLDRNHWARGFGDVELKVSTVGQGNLSLPSDHTTVYYHQGPILAPANNSELDDYEEWASFATEVTKEGVPGGIIDRKSVV